MVLCREQKDIATASQNPQVHPLLNEHADVFEAPTVNPRQDATPEDDAVGPVSRQFAGGVLVVVSSAPSTGCGVLYVQVLGGHPPGDWAREGTFLCHVL